MIVLGKEKCIVPATNNCVVRLITNKFTILHNILHMLYQKNHCFTNAKKYNGIFRFY